MSPAPNKLVFLERANYRQRRLRDAARLLPMLGAVLWILPLLWRDDAAGSGTGKTGIYIFAVWMFLIVLSAIISRRLRLDDTVAPEGTID
ncbi:hypothetical protein [Yoonia sp.]|uniref:hypothetical protein n=1 Tax=Yoonia sp. TaxID=2212373 RepID=UPI0019E09E05|nr:hypothetical protein [Yoonia sp.]MBE0414625.1 hypothetical protein [Yoonia sp.]